MASDYSEIYTRLGRSGLEWLCLLGGLVLVAVAVLLPAHRQLAEATTQLQWLRANAADWDRVNLELRQVDAELMVADPKALEHFAFHHLSLKPVGAQLLGQITDTSVVSHPQFEFLDLPDHKSPIMQGSMAWLTNGWMRITVAIFGVVCVSWALYRTAMFGELPHA
tara:strand:- start:753 stop:1250 length:498 start_codon:yes stop_codon:yes gene_type:complete